MTTNVAGAGPHQGEDGKELKAHTPGPVDHSENDEDELPLQPDAGHRAHDASMSRAELVDFAAQRGVRLSHEEQAAHMDHLRKVVLERLTSIV
ncbi:hypothetical protein FHT36_001741 [Xanthobacter sp. SG618]|uniref:hypothetical protein n=1 Tax=Xanthobacter sp. SG618 TaxID=2587121 RepID=UPI00145ECECB|nr:hypothetical protein [Xanthobacter sp. SG618]NMN57844.1 hypothetical protein [Xanthobacter sp. SG618]